MHYKLCQKKILMHLSKVIMLKIKMIVKVAIILIWILSLIILILQSKNIQDLDPIQDNKI